MEPLLYTGFHTLDKATDCQGFPEKMLFLKFKVIYVRHMVKDKMKKLINYYEQRFIEI